MYMHYAWCLDEIYSSIYDLVVSIVTICVYIPCTISTRFYTEDFPDLVYKGRSYLVEINNIILYFYNAVNPYENFAVPVLDKSLLPCYAR